MAGAGRQEGSPWFAIVRAANPPATIAGAVTIIADRVGGARGQIRRVGAIPPRPDTGYSHGHAVLLSGVLSGLTYLASLLGSYLSDSRLGTMSAMSAGTTALVLGSGELVLDRPALPWGTLALLLIGNRLFNPSLTTLVGKRYRANDLWRESGLAIFSLLSWLTARSR